MNWFYRVGVFCCSAIKGLLQNCSVNNTVTFQLNKKTNNNRPAAFYILIIVIPQCYSSFLQREIVLFGTLRIKKVKN